MPTPQRLGFLFDLHGVLADSWQYHLRSWQTIATELAIPWTAELAAKLPGMSRDDSLGAILASVGRQGDFNASQRQVITDHENTLYRQYVAALTPANCLPGIPAFLQELTEAGYPLAVASASTNAASEIDHLGLRNYFPHIVDARQLKASKPAPDVYLAAAKLVDREPGDCVAFEDTVTGVQSALAAGCRVVGINQNPLPGATVMVASTGDLSLSVVRQELDLPDV
ncbi:HAD family sugar phosphatase [Levilactobacillus paucivorans]|uniref:Beta-phosphoglucomutase n=1 Tax=Levilactobacillus paucivorans TaxID=616990 RepID=A0A0R2LZ52_9LACO|nr:beta-phosphoglucomutase family hydrolase [Levilactobacillus paucivorans]KRO03939.1 HAD family sugar phosphatase [Levilactobacillus paucivorans]